MAELESWMLPRSLDHGRRGTCTDENRVSDDIEHLEERLRRAEAELAHVNDSQRNFELHENRKVGCFLSSCAILF